MAERAIVSRLVVRDELTPSLQKAAAAAGRLDVAVVSATGSTTRLGKASRATSADIERSSQSMGSLKSAAMGLVGMSVGAALIGGLSKAKDAASDLNETLSKSRTIFGANAAEMEAWASKSVQNLGLSKAAALEAAASFGDMFSQLGMSGDRAAKTSQQVVQLAADLGSFNNMGTDDVLERISAGFRGEYDSLQKLIPNISSARVEKEALAATGKANAAALTAEEKATATLAIIQKDGARASGDFARTSGESAGQQRKAQAAAVDLAADIGNKLLPAWTAALRFTNTAVLPGLSATVSGLGKVLSAAAAVPAPVQAGVAALIGFRLAQPHLAALGSTLKGGIVGTLGSFREAATYAGLASDRAGGGFKGMAAGLRTFTGQAGLASAAMGGLRAAGSGLMGVLGGPWGLAIMAAAAGVTMLMQRHQEGEAAVQRYAAAIRESGNAQSEAVLKTLALDAANSGLLDTLRRYGVDGGTAVQAIAGIGDARERVNAVLEKASKAETEAALAATGGQYALAAQGSAAEMAAKQLKDYQDQHGMAGDVIRREGEASTAAADATRQLGSASQVAGAQVGGLAALIDAAKIKTQALDEALKSLSARMSAEAAADAFAKKIIGLDKALSDATRSLKGNSEGALQNREAMRGLVEEGVRVLQSMKERGATSDEITAKSKALATQIDREGAKHRLNKEEVKRYSNELRNIPAYVSTKVELAGINAVLTQLGRLSNALAVLPGSALINVAIAGAAVATRASGGPVYGPGTATSDSIPAWLSNGEYVINARQTAKHFALLEAINSGARGYADGGFVTRGTISSPTLSVPASITWDRGALRSLSDDIVNLLTGIEKPKLPEAVEKVRTGFEKVRDVLRGVISDADSLTEKLAKGASGASVGDLTSASAGKYGGQSLTAEQVRNAGLIAKVGRDLGVSEKGIVIALATAMQESKLRALNYGDRDSLGIFQQRTAWGSKADRMDVEKSARMFFQGGQAGQRGLLDVKGWQDMAVTKAAQAVQVSAFPSAYAQWEKMARQLTDVMTKGGGGTTKASGAAASVPTGSMNRNVVEIGRLVADMMGGAIKQIGGYRQDKLPEHPSGRAFDFMFSKTGTAATGAAKLAGDQLADWLVKNATELGLKNVIWQQKIWTASRAKDGFRAMSDRGSATQNHMDHVHAWFDGKKADASKLTGTVAGTAEATKELGDAQAKLADALKQLGIEDSLARTARLDRIAVQQLLDGLSKAQPEMEALAEQYDEVKVRAEAAAKAHEDLLKEAEDFGQSIAQQATARGNLVGLFKGDSESGPRSVTNVIGQLENAIVDTQKYRQLVQRAKDAGLGETGMRQVLSGASVTEGSDILSKILDEGPAAVGQINKLQDELARVSEQLGETSKAAGFDAGLETAAKIKLGIQAEQEGVEAQMLDLGARMRNALLQGLGLGGQATIIGPGKAAPATSGIKGAGQPLITVAPQITLALPETFNLTADGGTFMGTLRSEMGKVVTEVQQSNARRSVVQAR